MVVNTGNKRSQEAIQEIRSWARGFEFAFGSGKTNNHVYVTHPLWPRGQSVRIPMTPSGHRSIYRAYSEVRNLCEEFGPVLPERRKAIKNETEESRRRTKRRDEDAAATERLVRLARRRAERHEVEAILRRRERELGELDQLMREGPG